MSDQTYLAALAGLLHDIGKFTLRAAEAGNRTWDREAQGDFKYKHAMLTAERSPTVFKSMGEEDIRQIILLFLNAVFEGEALAEAFNFSGKTDILIRHQGKNVFVAECKFWTGPASLSGAIDQLLSYTTWRDTKTAIVLLNRGVAFSTLLARAPEVLRKHKSFVRESALGGDASFRAILSRPGDPARHVVLTVLAFDLPR